MGPPKSKIRPGSLKDPGIVAVRLELVVARTGVRILRIPQMRASGRM
jgi:hypothetical protein